MSIKELQSEVDLWIKTYGVRYYSELTNMAILTEECGEVAQLLSRMYGDQSFKKNEDEVNAKQNLARELADVLFVLTCIANQTNIDLQSAVIENMKLKGIRDQERHQSNPKLK